MREYDTLRTRTYDHRCHDVRTYARHMCVCLRRVFLDILIGYASNQNITHVSCPRHAEKLAYIQESPSRTKFAKRIHTLDN